ncbi:hypothetical protein AWZ03_007088 [Drosophila navojoa]|uniref:Uncharacterized protein n=1 Tax=Drosophila navojoa TaxID=7232 RepID=A0A484BCF2_DRONA|nr:hypothetical protein AWZ03_007088 [Drosophila navojoa]
MTKVNSKERNKSANKIKLKETNKDFVKRNKQVQIKLKAKPWLEMEEELNWVEVKNFKKEKMSPPLIVNKLD